MKNGCKTHIQVSLIVSAILMVAFGAKTVCATNYYVATNGNDDNPGTLQRPFRTIAKAAKVMSAGGTCFIRGGTYREEILIDGMNGTAEKPVTFRNYSNEEVVLDGTVDIDKGWSVYKGNIYQNTIPNDVWQLFVDDEMMLSARWPNTDFDNLWMTDETWGWGNEEDTKGVQTDLPHDRTDLRNLDFSVSDGGIAILNVGAFRTFVRKVNTHIKGSDRFTYTYDDKVRYKGGWLKHRYYLEGKLELLNTETEWFYNPADNKLYLWAPDGLNPAGLNIRGKVRDYAISITNSSYVTFSGLDFFATTFKIADCQHVTVAHGDLMYPNYSKRMLGDLSDIETTSIRASDINAVGSNSVVNCSFAYTDGAVIEIYGTRTIIENCEFHHVDFTAGIVRSDYNNTKSIHNFDGIGTIFRRNTCYIAGNTAFYRAGPSTPEFPTIVEYNRIHDVSLMGSDGATIQMALEAKDSIVRYNWMHDNRRRGLRYDGLWEKPDNAYGVRGLNHHNVIFGDMKQYGILIKGDEHETYNNIDTTVHETPNIVIRGTTGGNTNSITYNNAATTISGAKENKITPLPGKHSNNWIGNMKTQLRDLDNWDFRPRKDSDLIDAGIAVKGVTDGYRGKAPDIGAYEYGCTNYWIPGRQEEKASTPIPPDTAGKVKVDADMMWLGGYEALSHDIYFGKSAIAVGEAGRSSAEYKGKQSNNIYDPGTLSPDTTYYWRIDTVTASGTMTGDLWSFCTTKEGFLSVQRSPIDRQP